MDNVNKTNADRLRSAEDTVTGIHVQGPAIAVAVKEFLFEGETPRKLSIEELVALLGARLSSSNAQLRTADSVHLVETSGDVDARAARDTAIENVRAAILGASQAITGAFGPGVRASMGLDVTWEMRGDLLLGQVRNAAQLIRKTRKLQPAAAGVKVDTVEMADALEERCNELDAALEAVAREGRAAQTTFQERELAARVWERAYPGIAEIFTGLCILAGRDELAARVKPTVRKARSRGGKDTTSTTTSNGAVAPQPTNSNVAATQTASGDVAAPTSNGSVAAPAATHTDVVTR